MPLSRILNDQLTPCSTSTSSNFDPELDSFRSVALPTCCAGSGVGPALLAFTRVTVIDVTGHPTLPERTVMVWGDRIQSIGKFRRNASAEERQGHRRNYKVYDSQSLMKKACALFC